MTDWSPLSLSCPANSLVREIRNAGGAASKKTMPAKSSKSGAKKKQAKFVIDCWQ